MPPSQILEKDWLPFVQHCLAENEDETMLPVREVVWLEGKAYPLAWIRQITYPGILMPVEPVYISVLKGQLSMFWSWVYGSYGERRAQ